MGPPFPLSLLRPCCVSLGLLAQQQQQIQEQVYIPIEPYYLYSNRSYWYPQAQVTDYATAHLRVTVPPDLDVVATGIQQGPAAAAPIGLARAHPDQRSARPSGK